MDSYIQYSHEALCLLLERKDCEIERLTTKLAECTEEAARLKQNIVDTLTERLSDVETARKQVAREVEKHLLGMPWTIPYHETEAMIDRDEAIFWVRQRYGLEG